LENLSLKIKISVLWMFVEFDFLLLFTLNNFDPNGGLKQMISGFASQQLPLVLLGGAILLLIPLALAVLSLTLKDSSSRRANLIMGTVFAIFQFVGLVYGLSQLTASTAYLALITGAGFLAPVLVIRYAHSWPREDSH
jgi:multidrug transporter EmrE-like cation transporter